MKDKISTGQAEALYSVSTRDIASVIELGLPQLVERSLALSARWQGRGTIGTIFPGSREGMLARQVYST